MTSSARTKRETSEILVRSRHCKQVVPGHLCHCPLRKRMGRRPVDADLKSGDLLVIIYVS